MFIKANRRFYWLIFRVSNSLGCFNCNIKSFQYTKHTINNPFRVIIAHNITTILTHQTAKQSHETVMGFLNAHHTETVGRKEVCDQSHKNSNPGNQNIKSHNDDNITYPVPAWIESLILRISRRLKMTWFSMWNVLLLST